MNEHYIAIAKLTQAGADMSGEPVGSVCYLDIRYVHHALCGPGEMPFVVQSQWKMPEGGFKRGELVTIGARNTEALGVAAVVFLTSDMVEDIKPLDTGIDQFIGYMVDTFSKFFSLQDPAHGHLHSIAVTKKALQLNEKYWLGENPLAIVVAGMCHDLFTIHRKNHHVMAQVFLQSGGFWFEHLFDKKEWGKVHNAVLEHRASHQGKYWSMLSELIATADRGECLQLVDIWERAFQTANALINYPVSSQEHERIRVQMVEAEAIKHIQEKFSRVGYCRYPDLWKKIHGEALDTLYKQIDDIYTFVRLRKQ